MDQLTMSNIRMKIEQLNMEEIYALLKERKVQYGVVAGFCGAYFLYRMLKRNKYNMPPGPWKLPLFGNIFELRTMKRMNGKFTEWRKRYGDVFTVYLGPSPFVIFAAKDVIREAFITKGNDYSGRFVSPSFLLFSHGKDIVFSQPNPVWKLQRQIAHGAIRKYCSGVKIERALVDSFVMVNSYVEKREGKDIDIPELMVKLTYNFLATVCFGRQFEEDDPWVTSFSNNMNDVLETIGMGLISDFIPALAFLEQTKIKTFKGLVAELIVLFEKEFAEHKAKFDLDDPRDLTDEILLQLHKQETSANPDSVLSQLTREHLLFIIIDIFFAGTDSSRITLSLVIAYMARYPEIQAKLHAELDDVLGDSGVVRTNMKDRLPYTNAVVHEAMRLKSVVPIGVPHITNCDTSIGEYTIPKGTACVIHTEGVHHDPVNYENPKEFNPERWIDANGKFHYQPYIFIPFSMGPRVCVGEALARADLQICTAMFFHKYHVTPTEPNFEVEARDIMFGVDCPPYCVNLKTRH